MAVQDASGFSGLFHDSVNKLLTACDSIEVHDFSKAVNSVHGKQFFHLLCIHKISAVLKARSRGNGGRSHYKNPQGQSSAGFNKILYSFFS